MRLVLLFVVSLFAFACSRPAPPTLTPKQATVTGVTATNVEFEIEIDAFNPNAIPITARTVNGHVTLDGGKVDLGDVTFTAGIDLPAKGTTTIRAPLKATWRDIGAVAMLGASNRPIPYTITGTVGIGGERLSVEVPYKVEGAIRHQQLVDAALRSLPPMPSGFPRLTQ